MNKKTNTKSVVKSISEVRTNGVKTITETTKTKDCTLTHNGDYWQENITTE